MFGTPKYAGISLLKLYASESIGQLRLLLGHQHIRDKTINLISSYIQLLVTIGWIHHFIFQSPIPTILPPCWQLLANFNMGVTAQKMVPANDSSSLHSNTLKGERSCHIMDYLVTLKLPAKQLKWPNQYQVHLQFIYISDICSAEGRTILDCFKRGTRCPHHPQHTSLALPTESITSRLAPMGTNPPPPWEQRAPCESPRTMGWINAPILQTVLWMHLPQSLPSSKRAMVVLRTNLPEPGLIHPVSRKSLVGYVILNTCTSARNDAANTR